MLLCCNSLFSLLAWHVKTSESSRMTYIFLLLCLLRLALFLYWGNSLRGCFKDNSFQKCGLEATQEQRIEEWREAGKLISTMRRRK